MPARMAAAGQKQCRPRRKEIAPRIVYTTNYAEGDLSVLQVFYISQKFCCAQSSYSRAYER